MYPPYRIEEGEVDLLEYWRIFVRYKTMIISITLLATIAAVAIAFRLTPIYRAEVLLAPVSDDEQSSMSAIIGQVGGLASLAGINLGSSGGATDQVLATLTSKSFIGKFIDEEKLMPLLFADKWDKTTSQQIVESSDGFPTAQDAYKRFNDQILDVSTDKKTGLVTLSVQWKDPQQAANWANKLVARINRHEQQLAISEAEQSIAYLKQQLAKTSVVEMQQSVYQLMEAQTKKIMLASVRDQYAFKVIDPAVAPENRLKPNRKMITLLGFILGLMAALIGALVWERISKLKSAAV